LDELKKALEGAARCIELARREASRIDASMRARPSGGMQVEQAFLDTTRKRREQLSSFDLQPELPPVSPPRELPLPAPLSLAETSDTAGIETLVPELLSPV
jgi:hypothetical protein